MENSTQVFPDPECPIATFPETESSIHARILGDPDALFLTYLDKIEDLREAEYEVGECPLTRLIFESPASLIREYYHPPGLTVCNLITGEVGRMFGITINRDGAIVVGVTKDAPLWFLGQLGGTVLRSESEIARFFQEVPVEYESVIKADVPMDEQVLPVYHVLHRALTDANVYPCSLALCMYIDRILGIR